jgi:hypothetical protein
MTRAILVRTWAFRLAGSFCILASMYWFMGVLQAGSLYSGERALSNGNLWASLSLVCGFGAVHLFWAARPATNPVSSRAAQFLTVFWAAVFLAAGWQVVSHLLAVDRCIDQGASFDYVRGKCDLESSHSVISLVKTHGFLLVVAVLAAMHSALAFRRSRVSL